MLTRTLAPLDYSDEELAAFTIPVSWSTPDISIDSVSFAGGRIDYIGTKPLTIYNDLQKVVFGAIVFLEAKTCRPENSYGVYSASFFNARG